MPTLADIYGAAEDFKNRLVNAVQNPGQTLQGMVTSGIDRARAFSDLSAQAAQESMDTGQLFGPKTREIGDILASAYGPTGMVVWHGSPYRFTKFDANKIGSGEGNQVYGHGLYFAEAPAVAEGYQKRLAGGADPYTYNWQGAQYEGGVKGDPVSHALGLSYHQGPQVARNIAKEGIKASKAGEPWAMDMGGLDYYQKMYETASQIKKKDIKATQGALYKVDLPDEKISQMLDWDKPVPEEMRKKLSAIMMEKFGSGATGTSGEKLYKEIQKGFEWAGSKTPAKDASEFLKQQGIPGVRYLDAGSRKKGGTSNFVVFDPNDLSILERNSQPIK